MEVDVEIRTMEHMVDQLIELFQGEGESRLEKLNDVVRKSRTLVTGMEQMAGAIKRAAPFIYEKRTV